MKRWQYNDPMLSGRILYVYAPTKRGAAKKLGVSDTKDIHRAGYWDSDSGQVVGADAELVVDWWTA